MKEIKTLTDKELLEYMGYKSGNMHFELPVLDATPIHCKCNRQVCEHAIEQIADLPKKRKNEKACGRSHTE